LSKELKTKAVALWKGLLKDIEQLAANSGHITETLILALGAALKGQCSMSGWNAFKSLEVADIPRPKGSECAAQPVNYLTHIKISAVKHGEWINKHIRPKYDALFDECDETPLGQATRHKIVKDIVKRKKALDTKVYKKYAFTGKKFCVIQKVTAKLEKHVCSLFCRFASLDLSLIPTKFRLSMHTMCVVWKSLVWFMSLATETSMRLPPIPCLLEVPSLQLFLPIGRLQGRS
jgi:hypothetical protein